MPANRIRVVVVGASGYTGIELTKLLVAHPLTDIVAFISASSVGGDVAARLPVWRSQPRMSFQSITTLQNTDCDVVFFATPNEVAMRETEALLKQGKVVIDLGAAFRLTDEKVFSEWYETHSSAHLLPRAVYGLSEISRDALKTAEIIACPGCYATSIELALIPLVAGNHIRGNIIIDSKSGVSGAGRRTDRADLLLAEMADNYKAYALQGHRHVAEILQTLHRQSNNAPDSLYFVPHLLPIQRGIHTNIYLPVDDIDSAVADINARWRNEPFIETLPLGMVAELAQVLHTNRTILSMHPLSDKLLLVSVVLDNLQKGAAGQAIQNMNIRFNIDETVGLSGAITA